MSGDDCAIEQSDMRQAEASAEKPLMLALAIVASAGERPASEIAAELGLPPSSAGRLLKLLSRTGLLTRLSHGHYAAGPALEKIAGQVTLSARLKAAAKAPLRKLARATGATAHLGILEGDMVTYLAKESHDPQFQETKAGTQLEAYCTGIGKMLLAALTEKARDDFLANGPFVPITANTLTEPEELLADIQQCVIRDYAIDDAEMFEDIRCIAVPVRRDDIVIAAVSLSRKQSHVTQELRQRDLLRLKGCADEIAAILA